MSLTSPVAFTHFFQRTRTPGTNNLSEADVERQNAGATAHGHGREASGRSMLSNISDRLANMRERERETERNRQAMRAQAMAERLLNDLNNWRGGLGTRGAGPGADVEAQLQDPSGNADGVNPATGTATGSSMRKITGKSRREREEGATLFGPTLANYFGSGSSTSGAVAGSTNGPAANVASSSNAAAAAAAATAASSAPGDGTSPQTTFRRPRLGSRGRARGASLSGLSQWSLNADAIESVQSLSDPSSFGLPRDLVDAGATGTGQLTMAEGIELDTLRRWIERSTVGGTVEVANAEEAGQVHGHAGNPGTLCSTLQSYVNLKRNTVKLHAVPEGNKNAFSYSDQQAKSPLSPLSTFGGQAQAHAIPTPTHTVYFEYDCAAPFASVQVFVRASRKHGSWVTWTAAREAMGLPSDLTFGAEDDGESRFLGQRGPPPHVLGWPIHVARLRKGFSIPLSVNVALNLDLYAPPKAQPNDAKSAVDRVGLTTSPGPAVPAPALIPETPGLDSSRRWDDAVTPAAPSQPIGDPLSAVRSTESTQAPNAALGAPDVKVEVESKEAQSARERAERETLKIAVVVEALDEDGKPLREPNLQTTYMRFASMPVKHLAEDRVEVLGDLAEVGEEVGEGGAVVDVALPPSDDRVQPDQLTAASTPHTTTKRAWSVQVEGQEAEIGPHRFQLQELYGLSTRPPPPQQQQLQDNEAIEGPGEEAGATNDATPDINLPAYDNNCNATECLICLSNPPTTLLLPCTHGLCLDCAVQLRDTVKSTRESERRRGRRPKRKYACPVCRRVYTSMLHLSAVDEKYLAQAAAV